MIEDIAYFGSHSVYHVRLPSGAKVLANFANSQRWASDGLTWGTACGCTGATTTAWC